MLINIKLTDILETGTQYTKNIPLALALGSLFFYEIFTIMPFSHNNFPSISLGSHNTLLLQCHPRFLRFLYYL